MIRLCPPVGKMDRSQVPRQGLSNNCRRCRECASQLWRAILATVNLFDTSESESGGAPLDSSSSSDTDSTTPNNPLAPISSGPKGVVQRFFPAVSRTTVGHIHWEVEVNCRFCRLGSHQAWQHLQASPGQGKTLLLRPTISKTARQSARDRVEGA